MYVALEFMIKVTYMDIGMFGILNSTLVSILCSAYCLGCFDHSCP